jgi:hypothetical protein
VYDRLQDAERLVLHAAVGLNERRIDRGTLGAQLDESLGWGQREYMDALGGCLDLHLLRGQRVLTMHQLFATFLRALPVEVDHVRQVQLAALRAAAAHAAANPTDGASAVALLDFALIPSVWEEHGLLASDSDAIRNALLRIGQVELAGRWPISDTPA